MFNPKVLWSAPQVDPISKKAYSIPAFNPANVYGRVFFFSWWGFMVAFMSWYAFPPLLTKTIKADINLTQTDIANSNIFALTATLLVRFCAGPLCDMFGPRKVFAGCLLLGAVPTAMAGLVTNSQGLIALRFFIGILGGSFVPCQVWSTGFFDKKVVGTANALTGGFGNSGGGITYFVMPAIFDHFVSHYGLTPHVAWRVSFLVPFAIITGTAISMLLLCPDTPHGKWADRHDAIRRNLEASHATGKVVMVPSGNSFDDINTTHSTEKEAMAKDEKRSEHSGADIETSAGQVVDASDATYNHEVVQKPTAMEIVKVTIASPQAVALGACYICSFGAELAVNSILGAYYLQNFKQLTQTSSGQWAAMFGLLNVYGRPLGGIVGDIIYKYTNGNLWAKKAWIHALGLLSGVACILIGSLNPHDLPTMIGLVALLAFGMDAGNGANFALVPHVHPFANGVVSGFVGACGNLGGIFFAIAFRYNGTDYAKTMWIIGVITIALNLSVAWIKPIPAGQIGGR